MKVESAAAVGGGVQAVQQLDRRDRVAVGVVGVRGDRQPREGQVGRGRLGAHVEQAAVVGLPHVAQAPGHGQHGPRLAGHLVQDDHAVGQHGRQARAAVLGVGPVARPPALRDPAAEVGRRPQALGVLGPVVVLTVWPPVAVPGEPARGEDRPVAVRAKDHFYGAVRCQDPRHGHVGREVGDGDEALPAARVPAAGARAVGAQPDRGQPSQRRMARAVGQACHTALRRVMAMAAQPAAPGCPSCWPGCPVTPQPWLPTSVNAPGTECQLRWRSLPDSATQLPIAVHPHDPPGRGSHPNGTLPAVPRAKPGRDAGSFAEDRDTRSALFRQPGDSGYRGHHGYPCPQGRCPAPGRDSRARPFARFRRAFARQQQHAAARPRVRAQGRRPGQEHAGRLQARPGQGAQQAPATAADRPDHDLHWLGGPCGVGRVDAARPRGRGRGPGAGPQRARPRPAAPAGRRGPGLPRQRRSWSRPPPGGTWATPPAGS